MGFKIPTPKELIRYYQHAKCRVPIVKTLEVIAVYSFQCKSMSKANQRSLIRIRFD